VSSSSLTCKGRGRRFSSPLLQRSFLSLLKTQNPDTTHIPSWLTTMMKRPGDPFPAGGSRGRLP